MRRALVIAFVALAACAGVLGLHRTPKATLFAHRAHVLAGVACTTCHAGVANSDSSGPLHIPEASTCLTCHTKPHDTHDCLECHADPDLAAQVLDARSHLRFTHAAHPDARRGMCVTCHRGIATGDGPLRPTMSTCFSCHDKQENERDCKTCHVNLAEEGTLPSSHLAHDNDWIHRHGTAATSSSDLCGTCHQQKFCAGCHGVNTAALPATLHFDQPSTASVHRAGFASHHAIEARAAPGACATCHAPSSCEHCHDEKNVSDNRMETQASPHGPGWVGLTLAGNEHGRAARRDPAACAACHDGAGETLCIGCHAVGGVGGNPHPPGWTSTQSYGDLPCRLCHRSP